MSWVINSLFLTNKSFVNSLLLLLSSRAINTHAANVACCLNYCVWWIMFKKQFSLYMFCMVTSECLNLSMKFIEIFSFSCFIFILANFDVKKIKLDFNEIVIAHECVKLKGLRFAIHFNFSSFSCDRCYCC